MHIHYFGQGGIVSNSYEILYLNSKEYIIFDIVIRNYSKYGKTEIIEKKILRDLSISFTLNDISTLNQIVKRFIKFIDLDKSHGEISYTGVRGMYYPSMLTLFITNRCFHGCVHCFRNSSMDSKEMDVKDIKDILDKIRGKVPYIVLSGGEPLIHRNIEEIIENMNGFSTTGIVTSLYGIKSDKIKNLNIFSEIQVSIYGWDEESHDKFANAKGSFNKVWANIRQAVNNGKNIIVASMNNNIHRLEEIVNLCIASGVKRLKFGDIVQTGRAESNSKDINEYLVNKKYVVALQEKYNEQIEILYDTGCSTSAKSFHCGAGIYKLDIDEGGNVFPCLFGSNLSLGNIIKDKEIFNNRLKVNRGILDDISINCLSLKKFLNM